MRGRSIASLVLLALLLAPAAGCLGAEEARETQPDPSPPRKAGPLHLNMTVPAEGDRVGEPVIEVAPDGETVYMTARDGGRDVNLVYRSDDAGRTWTSLGPVAEAFGTNDGDITVREDGSVWVATFWGEPGPYCTAVSVSQDRGESWTTNPLACNEPVGDERPWLATGPERTHMLHAQTAFVSVPGVFFQREKVSNSVAFSQRGEDWTNVPTSVPRDTLYGPLVASGETLMFPYGTTRFSEEEGFRIEGPNLAISTDGGLAWETQPIADEEIQFRWIQTAVTGNQGVMAWARFDGDAESGSIVRASFLEDGSWSTPRTLQANGTNGHPWAAARNGHVVLGWMHADAEAHPHQMPNGTEWQLQLWTNGTVLDTDRVLQRGPLCAAYFTPGNPCPEGSRTSGEFLFSFDLLPSGEPVIAGVDATAEDASFFQAPLRVFRPASWPG